MKYSLEGFKDRFWQAEKGISKLENRTREIVESEEQKEKIEESEQN